MTEQEWQLCTDPDAMLEWLLLRKLLKDSQRRLPLLASAACRRQWYRFLNHSQRVIEVVERYADGQAPQEEVRRSLDPFIDEDDFPINPPLDTDEGIAWALADRLLGRIQVQEVLRQLRGDPGDKTDWHLRERQAQAHLVREIFGNPFRPARCRRAWLRWNDRTIPNMAQSIYEERDFDRLPVLGDALEDAGCTNADMLSHCRQPGEHVRGCWVVDLVLGKK